MMIMIDDFHIWTLRARVVKNVLHGKQATNNKD